ncbi:MAG: carbohydrate ABC transporter permease [Candidatus Vecturithrix sp.]|nr:carbohydrate ABC transporter permease [Candidatus Vecturithrix sp.]
MQFYRKQHLINTSNFFISLLLLIVVLLPILWAVNFSLKPPGEQYSLRTIFSANYTFENYKNALYPAFVRYILNSILVSVGTAVAALTISLFAAYAFSRLRFWGRQTLFIGILLSQLIPITIIIIPVYQVLKALRLINSYPGLILAYLTFTVPVSIWMLKGFFDNIPIEIEEAATIDGCTKLSAFFRVVLPISKPGVTATIVWILIATWQEMIYALTVMTSKEMRTISVGILDFFGQWTIDYPTLFAGAIIVSVPIVVVFIFLQKYFVAGLAEGAVKG